MRFCTYIPSDLLKPFVKSFVISENASADSYSVLPDTNIVMGFQYSGNLSYLRDSETMPLNQAGITGLQDQHRIFSNSENTGTVLVIFTETGASAFFSQPMHELFSQSISLDDLILHSQMDLVTENICAAKTDVERIRAVEKFLLSRLTFTMNDELVNTSIKWIRLANGNIKISELAEKLNLSQSRFEKRFRKTVGASPKKFASIVRFRSLINESDNDETLTQLGLKSGYFDQAHFIKDFKSFTGQTPSQYFRDLKD